MCPSCRGETRPGHPYCELCGADLVVKRATQIESSSIAPAPMPHPSQKRKTLYEPEAEAPRPGPISSRPNTYDPFEHPLPPRAAIDRDDPFRGAVVQPPPPRSAPVPPPKAASKSTTVLDLPRETSRLLGAVVEHRGADDPGRVHALRQGRNTLGRNDDQDICLDDGRVSGQHGFLFATAGGASYIDISTNGTLVDGNLVHGGQVTLRHGSQLLLGSTTLVLLLMPGTVTGGDG